MFAGIIFPLVPCAGVNENALPLHASMAGTVIVALGLIVTVYVNVAPSQLPVLGVTV